MKKKLILIPLLTVMLIVALIVGTGCTGGPGPRGIPGIKGIDGAQGEQGERGELGIEGTIGSQGEVGIQGVMGRTGMKGTTGSLGATGEQGGRGRTGAGARGATGAIGATGLDGADGADGWLPPTLRDVSTYGNFQPAASVYAWQSHSYGWKVLGLSPGDPTYNDAGAIILATGSIETMGEVSTKLSMAYTWDFYSFNKVALLYGYDQAGAPTSLDDVKGYTPHVGLFDITYTLKITDEGDLLALDIVGGYVKEGPAIYWDGDVANYTPHDGWVAADGQGTENTWIIGLSIDGSSSTGTFLGATGEGLIRLVVQSNNHPTVLESAKHVSAYEIYLRID